MRNKFAFLFIFLFYNFGINLAIAHEWELVKGIEDTKIDAIVINEQDPNIIYLGSKSIYKSKDKGKSWNCVFSLPSMATVNFLLADKNSIYAASESGLFKSDDNGKKWHRIFKGVDEESSVLCLDLDKQNNFIYIGTQSGLFRSNNNKIWQRSSGKLSSAAIYSLKIDSHTNIIYTVTDQGFFKTNDQGKSWRRTFVSSVSEETKEKIKRLNDLAIDGKRIYLSGKDCLLMSKDKGETWQEIDRKRLSGADIRSLVVSNNKIYLGTNRGVFKREIKLSGEKEEEIRNGWEEIYVGLPSLNIKKIALVENDLWAITDKGVFKQTEIASRQKKIERNIEQEIFELFANEPSICEVQEKAIEYAEVHPDKIKNWRRLAAKRAILPKFSVGANRNVTDLYHWEGGSTAKIDDDFLRKGRDVVEWDVSLSWDFGDLIWNADQTSIDARSKLMVQLREDVLDETTRTYFERKRLKIELFMSLPEDRKKRIEKNLRLEELTANLDALTGGWFSSEIGR